MLFPLKGLSSLHGSQEPPNKDSIKESGSTRRMSIDFTSYSLKVSINDEKESKTVSKQWEKPDPKKVKLKFSALLKYDKDENVRADQLRH